MKLFCEVEIADRNRLTVLDAIEYAYRHEELWRIRENKEEQRERRMRDTSLVNKCGSCVFFKPVDKMCGSSCYGECLKGRVCGARTRRACTKYERNKDK